MKYLGYLPLANKNKIAALIPIIKVDSAVKVKPSAEQLMKQEIAN